MQTTLNRVTSYTKLVKRSSTSIIFPCPTTKLDITANIDITNQQRPVYKTQIDGVETASYDLLDLVTSQKVQNLLYLPEDSSFYSDVQFDGFLFFSGSFNPIHKGHKELLEIASKRFSYGKKIVCEISVVRDGKPALTNEELGQRIELFQKAQIPLLLTTTTYFKTKIKFLKNGAFIMGADTY